MSDNYVSPYGFGPVTDFCLDAICDRRDIGRDAFAEAVEHLPDGPREQLEDYINDSWWASHMGPAIDRLEDELTKYIDLEGLSE